MLTQDWGVPEQQTVKESFFPTDSIRRPTKDPLILKQLLLSYDWVCQLDVFVYDIRHANGHVGLRLQTDDSVKVSAYVGQMSSITQTFGWNLVWYAS